MQVRRQFGELCPRTLLLPLLLILPDLAVVGVQVAANLVVLGLNILQVLLAGVEIVLPTTTVVPTIAVQMTGKEPSLCQYFC